MPAAPATSVFQPMFVRQSDTGHMGIRLGPVFVHWVRGCCAHVGAGRRLVTGRVPGSAALPLAGLGVFPSGVLSLGIGHILQQATPSSYWGHSRGGLQARDLQPPCPGETSIHHLIPAYPDG